MQTHTLAMGTSLTIFLTTHDNFLNTTVCASVMMTPGIYKASLRLIYTSELVSRCAMYHAHFDQTTCKFALKKMSAGPANGSFF